MLFPWNSIKLFVQCMYNWTHRKNKCWKCINTVRRLRIASKNVWNLTSKHENSSLIIIKHYTSLIEHSAIFFHPIHYVLSFTWKLSGLSVIWFSWMRHKKNKRTTHFPEQFHLGVPFHDPKTVWIPNTMAKCLNPY